MHLTPQHSLGECPAQDGALRFCLPFSAFLIHCLTYDAKAGLSASQLSWYTYLSLFIAMYLQIIYEISTENS